MMYGVLGISLAGKLQTDSADYLVLADKCALTAGI